MGAQAWYPKAQQMCSTIGLKSPEELKSMLQRSQTKAETVSGQLLRETCQKFEHAISHMAITGDRQLQKFQREPWYASAVVMCTKFGVRKVDVKDLASRCARIAKLEKSSNYAHVQNLPWYKHLVSTCKSIKSEKESSGKKGAYSGKEGA